MKRLEGKKILVVDDEPGYREILAEEFFLEGAQTLHAGDGNEALDLCKTNSDIDLIVSDIQMPGIDGILLLTRVVSLYPWIPVILSGGTSLNLQSMKHSGAKGVFDKPCDIDSMIDRMQALLKKPCDSRNPKAPRKAG